MIVLVTGATAGFGTAIARRYLKEGHKVIAVGRRAERLEALRSEFSGAALHIGVLDVRDAKEVEAFVAGLPADFAAVDVLVNNAGLALGLGPAQRASLADWEQMVDTNV